VVLPLGSHALLLRFLDAFQAALGLPLRLANVEIEIVTGSSFEEIPHENHPICGLQSLII
jgi:hypothetical protein